MLNFGGVVIYKLKRFKSQPPWLVYVVCLGRPSSIQQIKLQTLNTELFNPAICARTPHTKHSTNREILRFFTPEKFWHMYTSLWNIHPFFFRWLWHTSNKNTKKTHFPDIFRSPQGTDSKVSRKKEAKRVTLPKRMTRKRRRSRSTRVLARSVWLSLSWEKLVLPVIFEDVWRFFTLAPHLGSENTCIIPGHPHRSPKDSQGRKALEI